MNDSKDDGKPVALGPNLTVRKKSSSEVVGASDTNRSEGAVPEAPHGRRLASRKPWILVAVSLLIIATTAAVLTFVPADSTDAVAPPTAETTSTSVAAFADRCAGAHRAKPAAVVGDVVIDPRLPGVPNTLSYALDADPDVCVWSVERRVDGESELWFPAKSLGVANDRLQYTAVIGVPGSVPMADARFTQLLIACTSERCNQMLSGARTSDLPDASGVSVADLHNEFAILHTVELQGGAPATPLSQPALTPTTPPVPPSTDNVGQAPPGSEVPAMPTETPLNCGDAYAAMRPSVGDIALGQQRAQVNNDISHRIKAHSSLCVWEVGWYSFDGLETWYVAKRHGLQSDGRFHFESFIGGPGPGVTADTKWVRKVIACTTERCNDILSSARKGNEPEATAVRVPHLNGEFVVLRTTNLYGPNLSKTAP